MITIPLDDRRKPYATGHLALHWPKAASVIDHPANVDKTATIGTVQTLSTELRQAHMLGMQAGPSYWHSHNCQCECSWGMHYLSPTSVNPAIYHRGFPYLIDVGPYTPVLPDAVCVLDYYAIPEELRAMPNETHGMAIEARATASGAIQIIITLRRLRPLFDNYGYANVAFTGSGTYQLTITVPADCIGVDKLLFSGDTAPDDLYLVAICSGDGGDKIIDRYDIAYIAGEAWSLSAARTRVATFKSWRYRAIKEDYAYMETFVDPPEGYTEPPAVKKDWSWTYAAQASLDDAGESPITDNDYLIGSMPRLVGNTLIFIAQRLEAFTVSGAFSASQTRHAFVTYMETHVNDAYSESLEVSYHRIDLDVVNVELAVTPLSIPNSVDSLALNKTFSHVYGSDASGSGDSETVRETVEFRNHPAFDVLLCQRTGVTTTVSSSISGSDVPGDYEYTISTSTDIETAIELKDHSAALYAASSTDSSSDSVNAQVLALTYSSAPPTFSHRYNNLSELCRFAETGDKALVIVNVDDGGFVKSILYDRQGEVESVADEIIEPDLPLSIVSHVALAARAWQPLTQYTRGGIKEIRFKADLAWQFWGDPIEWDDRPDFFLSRTDIATMDPVPDFYFGGEFILVPAQGSDYPWQYWMTTNAGISGDTEPDWPSAAASGMVSDGDVDAGTHVEWRRIGCVFRLIYK